MGDGDGDGGGMGNYRSGKKIINEAQKNIGRILSEVQFRNVKIDGT